ncbi:MAG: VWA domain-containing protein [Bryobacteraceae bacterium]
MTYSARIFAVLAALPLPCLFGQQPTFSSEVDLRSLSVRVTDRKDNAVHGLSADRFTLFENGVRQKISFFAAEEEPVSLGILLDVSSSMTSSGKLDEAKKALSAFVGSLRPEDEAFYLRFHRRVDRMVDFTNDSGRIRAAIAKTDATQDGTSLYDAVAEALCFMRTARHHRQALLVITDGADQHSHRTLDELIPIIQASQSQVFMIGYFGKAEYDLYHSLRDKKLALVTSQQIDNPVQAFRRLAEESGAESFFPSSVARLQETVDAVAHQLKTQYTLAYYPHSAGNGFRHLKVTVAQPGVRIRARRGFGDIAAISPGQQSGCAEEKLRPYPWESKVESIRSCSVYRENFQNEASGWPTGARYHYTPGSYELANANKGTEPAPLYAPMLSYVPFSAGSVDPAKGVLVANGPAFEDLNASISIEFKSGTGDLASAAGLAFRLNDRGYYAVIISPNAGGSRKVSFKLIKKYHYATSPQDLSPWTEIPISDLIGGPEKKLSIQCRGKAIRIFFHGQVVAKFEDPDFEEGVVGMVMYGTGRASFRDLLVEEICKGHV